uniref:NADH-ubiquinone oxidoreductase chain 4L n=1 Tax=Metopiellus crypticus TaxID=3140185 RepID=A0AAT9QEU9_9COLE|nr:NADH dehydrogenase subunit 4l [Metopiellus sp.]UUK33579.1 NADH dehydrogenase subunit 4l [Metopiellus sp.]
MYSLIMFICGLISLCLKFKHLLMMLLSLEFIILSIYLSLYFMLIMYNYEFYMLMIFLSMSVCESVLGLSILVYLIRTSGNDYLKTFNMLW